MVQAACRAPLHAHPSGLVSLHWQLSKDGKTLDVKYETQFRHKPGKVILHIPPVEGLKAVRLNGQMRFAAQGARLLL